MASKKNLYIFFSTSAVIGLTIYLIILLTKKITQGQNYVITQFDNKQIGTNNLYTSQIVYLKPGKSYNIYGQILLRTSNTLTFPDQAATANLNLIEFIDSKSKADAPVVIFSNQKSKIVSKLSLIDSFVKQATNVYVYSITISDASFKVISANGFVINITIPASNVPFDKFIGTNIAEQYSCSFIFEEII